MGPNTRALVPAAPTAPRGGWLGRLLGPFFQRVQVPGEVADRLREAHARGVVVHVLRSRRVVDPIFILSALERLGLPRPTWMHDHYCSGRPPTVQALLASVRAGEPVLLFLRRPQTLTNPQGHYAEQHVEALVGLQRELDRPILLLPESLLWTRRAAGLRRSIVDSIFGGREAPGRLRELLGFFWNHGDSRFHVGAPVDLQAVLEREKGNAGRVVAKKIRWSILHHLSREEALRTGPVYRTAARTRQSVLHDPAVRRYLAREGADTAQEERRADQIVRSVAADVRYGWLVVLDALIDLAWSRIYDGIVVDAEGLERVRSAARRGAVVLVPSHKSHIDYLVLSQVFFKEGLMPPHVAAGENLNFPPVGAIFRRAGAFFLKRTFKGDKLYALVFAAYVRRLLKEGHALEFFIEGGRSRTGKILAPKMGMLSMCAEPVLEGSIPDVSFIPVSISYEKIVEARAYAQELAGGQKKREDARALLSATGVLRSRYGRVYVDFAEPIALRAFAAARGFEVRARGDLEEEAPAAVRQLIHQLGHRIVFGINAVTRVTPTSVAALVLLSRTRRGMAEEELYAHADRLLGFLGELGARASATLAPETRREALREAIGRLAGDRVVQMVPAPEGGTIFRVDEDGRRALDYYKNNILHYFVPAAVVATAVLSARTQAGVAPDQEVRAKARAASRMLKLEFSFAADAAGFDANFRAAAERLLARRTLEQKEGGWAVTHNGRAEAAELAGMIAVFFEAYRAAAEALVAGVALPEKKWAQRIMLLARKQVLEGKLVRAEGATQQCFEQALQRMTEEGVLLKDAGGGLALAAEDKRQRFVDELNGYLAPLLEA